MFKILPIDQVHPAVDNVRRRLGDTRDLAASILSVGIVEPLLVTPRPDGEGGYTVVAGHRRLVAARAAGLVEVPCTVRTLTDLERVEIMVAENLARAGLSVMEEASGYFRMAEFGLTVKDLAKRLGRSVPHIKARLAFLELPKAVQAKVDSGTVTVSEATALLALKDQPEVIVRLLADDGDPWARRDLERAVVREVSRIEAEANVAAARARDEQGVTVIDEWDRYGSRPRQPLALGAGHGEVDVKPAKHRGEPCHAAHVNRQGEVVWLCTDPGRHRPAGDSKTKTPVDAGPTRTETKVVERAEAKKRRDVDRERRAFCADLLTRRLPKGDTHTLIATQLVAGAGTDRAKAACGLLSLEAATETVPDSHGAVLASFAAGSASQRDRACLALTLAAGDDALGYDPTGTGDIAATHLAFLADYGWPTPEPAIPVTPEPAPRALASPGQPGPGPQPPSPPTASRSRQDETGLRPTTPVSRPAAWPMTMRLRPSWRVPQRDIRPGWSGPVLDTAESTILPGSVWNVLTNTVRSCLVVPYSLEVSPMTTPTTIRPSTLVWLDGRDLIPTIVWHDPTLTGGFEPCGDYVETYWLAILGPSSTWALRRLAGCLTAAGESGVWVPIEPLARSLGLGSPTKRNSPARRAISRLVDFRLAYIDHDRDVLAVRTVIPVLADTAIGHLPAHLRFRHQTDHPRIGTTHPVGEGSGQHVLPVGGQVVVGRQRDREAPLPPFDPPDGQTRPNQSGLTTGLSTPLSTPLSTRRFDSQGASR